MRRVSSDMGNVDMQFHLRRHEYDINGVQNRMGTQKRIKELRDDPLGAARAVRIDSFIARAERYELNAARAEEAYRVAEGYLSQTMSVMQRIRELAVQGATGTMTPDDMKANATVVDELLRELVELANARTSADGGSLFGGDRVDADPYRVVMGRVPGAEGPAIARVEYLGSTNETRVQIAEGASMPLNLAGNSVFWAERQQVFSSFDAREYSVLEPGAIRVDGVEIGLEPGDNIHSIIAKINESGAPVRAYLDPSSHGLSIEGTSAHQLWLEDARGSTFQDLGILRGAGSGAPAPENYAPTARVAGGSLFDAVIHLRDALYRGDGLEVGGAALGGIDLGIANLAARTAELGSRVERLESVQARLNAQIPDLTAQLARETDLDYAQAVIDLARLEAMQKAALSVQAKTMKQTLLDFLR
jgi:flagellar hook-associated protein 3 FlgL